MELFVELVKGLNDLVWGPAMLVLILGTGIYLNVGLRLMPLAKLGYGFRTLWQGRTGVGEGEISPFNALMKVTPKKEPRPLIRHVQGHLGFAKWPDGGLVTGSSNDSKTTDITLRTTEGSILWNITVPGRMSAEPYVGPDGEVYVATCMDWDCRPPYTLFSITGKKPTEDSDEKEQ